MYGLGCSECSTGARGVGAFARGLGAAAAGVEIGNLGTAYNPTTNTCSISGDETFDPARFDRAAAAAGAPYNYSQSPPVGQTLEQNNVALACVAVNAIEQAKRGNLLALYTIDPGTRWWIRKGVAGQRLAAAFAALWGPVANDTTPITDVQAWTASLPPILLGGRQLYWPTAKAPGGPDPIDTASRFAAEEAERKRIAGQAAERKIQECTDQVNAAVAFVADFDARYAQYGDGQVIGSDATTGQAVGTKAELRHNLMWTANQTVDRLNATLKHFDGSAFACALPYPDITGPVTLTAAKKPAPVAPPGTTPIVSPPDDVTGPPSPPNIPDDGGGDGAGGGGASAGLGVGALALGALAFLILQPTRRGRRR